MWTFCDAKRSGAVLDGGVNLGAIVEQAANDVDAIVTRSRHQRRLTIVVAELNVGAALDEQLDDGEMIFLRGVVECCETVVVDNVDLGTAIE